MRAVTVMTISVAINVTMVENGAEVTELLDTEHTNRRGGRMEQFPI